ncbi:MAG: phosphoribosylanthranilate isomerase [Acidobacteriota bacterium]
MADLAAAAASGAAAAPAAGMEGRRPRVKICGVTRPEDARSALDRGAELIGLNFYPPSPRALGESEAKALIEQADPGRVALWVGVFVNEPIERARALGERVGLDLLQFHGDESPRDLAPVAARSIKALRVRERLTPELLEPWLDLGLWGLLVDARHETLYGGSGRGWDFASASGRLETRSGEAAPRLLIAGGLGPDNVRQAAAAARPWGLDLASGVESSPGVKDPILIQRLFSQLTEEMPHGTTPSQA